MPIDEVDIPVAISLHVALEAIRQKGQTVWVWVDTLCVDQQNKEERDQQGKLMASMDRWKRMIAIEQL